MALQPALQPDRLVAFLAELHDGIASPLAGGEGARQYLQAIVDRAVEANLTTGELVVPEYDPDAGELDEQGKFAQQLHDWAFALTGSTAKARHAVSQLGLSDGQTPGLDGTVQPDRIGGLVAEVADRMAREGE